MRFLLWPSKHGLIVIEDACHALGAEYRRTANGKHRAHVGVQLSSGEAHDDRRRWHGHDRTGLTLLRRCAGFEIMEFRAKRASGRLRGSGITRWCLLGFNYRLPTLRARSASQQLKKLEAESGAAAADCGALHGGVSSDAGRGSASGPARGESGLAFVSDPARSESAHADRAQVFRALRAENIGVNVHYIPVHLHPYYRDRFGLSRRGTFRWRKMRMSG